MKATTGCLVTNRRGGQPAFLQRFPIRQGRALTTALVTLLFLAAGAASAAAQAYFSGTTVTVAGSYSHPQGVAVDVNGDLFVADAGNNAIEEVSGGTETALPGSGNYTGSLTCSITFNGPVGVAVDGQGNLFVADTNQTSSGHTGAVEELPYSGGAYGCPQFIDSGYAFSYPEGVAVDSSDNVYVTDSFPTSPAQPSIQKIAPPYNSTSVTAVATSGFQTPVAVAVDSQGNVWVADQGGGGISAPAVYEVKNNGGGSYGTPTAYGSGWSAPEGIAFDASGNLFVADTHAPAIREIVAQSGVLPASPTPESLGSGLARPVGVAVDSNGDVFTGDYQNGVLEIQTGAVNAGSSPVGTTIVTPVAVSFGFSGAEAGLSTPVYTNGGGGPDYATAVTGNTCTGNKGTGDSCTVDINFTPSLSGTRYGAVTLESNGTPIATAFLYGTGTGPQIVYQQPTTTTPVGTGFTAPASLAVDGGNNVFVADPTASYVYKVASGSTSQLGFYSGAAGVAFDAQDDVFVAGNGAGSGGIEEITFTGSTVALGGSFAFSGPRGIALDRSGNLYVADTGNNAVEEVYAASGYTAVATIGSGFSGPTAVAVDGSGNVFVADTGNNAVKEIVAANGVVSASSKVNTLGGGFSSPDGIAVDANGSVYVADSGNKQIVEIPWTGSAFGTQVALATGLSSAPAGVAVDGSGNVYYSAGAVVTELNLATPPTLNFEETELKTTSSDSPLSVTVANDGNQALTFSAVAFPADFTADSTNACTSTTSVSQGTSCKLEVDFDPQTTGPLSEDVTLTDNALDVTGAQQQIPVTGTAIDIAITPTTLSAGTVGSAYGPVTFTASGGTGTSYTWSDTGLPAGMSFTPSSTNPSQAVLAGTPTAAVSATNNFTVSVTDTGTGSSGVEVTNTYTLDVSGATVVVNWAPPSSITYGANLSTVLTATATEGSSTGSTVAGSFAYTAKLLPSGTATTVSATTVLPAGSYSVTATFTSSDPTDYPNPAPVSMTLTVNPATLTVTANNASRAYGAANPTFTATITGFVNGDTQATATTGTPSLTTTATATSPVGPYTITAAVGTLASTNYTFTYVNGTLTITQATLTVTANNASRAYGAANPTFTAMITGFVNGDTQATATTGTPSLTTTATATSPVGPYPITAAAGTLASTNYTFTYVNGTLTITQATLTVTANNASRAYGTANPTFTATITGFVNGDTQATATTGTPSLTTTATATSPVGPYPITAAAGTLASTNYTFTYVNGTLTVTQATLTVTANNASRAYGAANPTFTATITGFVNGDTQATATTGTPSLTTTATATSPAGPYPITAAAGTLASTNYTFTYVNGTLTITQATPTITWATPAAITYGTALSATQLDATSTVPGTFAYTPGVGTVLNAGANQTLSVKLTPTDSTDYATATATVQITVNAAAPTITFAVPNHVYGDAPFTVAATSNSTGTITYSVVSGPASIAGSTVTLTGTGNVVLEASQAAAGNYTAGTQTASFTVTSASVNLTFAAIPAQTYGNGPFTVSASSISTGAITYSIISGPATVNPTTGVVTLTGAGSLTIGASQAATSNYGVATAQTTIVVAQQASQTTVTASSTSVNPSQSVTLTATVAAAVTGTPTGTVTFFSGTTQLGAPVTLTNGSAQLAVTTLLSGSDPISATYSGDTNFLVSSGSLSGGITVAPLGFTMTATPATQTGLPGTTFTYQLALTPTYGTYPGTVNFTATGLPTGATATFSPSTLAAGAGAQTVSMALTTTSSTTAASHDLPIGRKLAPLSLALLLLPLAGTRRMRRQGRRFGQFLGLLLLALAGIAATTALTGCGTSGYQTSTTTTPQNYTITVTATSGSVTQTSTVTLSLQ